SGASSSFARNTLRAEVGFIDFNCSFQPMLRLGPMENFTAQVPKDTRYRTPADTAKCSGVRSGESHRKIPNSLPRFRLRYFCTLIILVIHFIAIYYKELQHAMLH